MTATNKRYSYLRVTTTQINVHPTGETRSTCHTLFMLDPHRVPDHTSHMVHVGNLSLVSTRTKHAPTSKRSLDDQRQTSPAVALGHLILSPSRQPWSRGERFQLSDYTATSAYWAHIPACDRYVQCLLAVANPSVLNRHRWGLQPLTCWLSTYHSLTFPTDGLHFPPKGPARSQVKQAQHKPLAIKIKAPSRRVVSMPLDLYRTYNCA
jgi:hypothetical protein